MSRDMQVLSREGLRVIDCNAEEWATDIDMAQGVLGCMGLGTDYNGSLDYLQEQVEHGVSESDVAIGMWGFGKFLRRSKNIAVRALDVFASASRRLQIMGQTVIVLVQSDEVDVHLPAVGGCKPWWNPSEFMRSDRSPKPL